MSAAGCSRRAALARWAVALALVPRRVRAQSAPVALRIGMPPGDAGAQAYYARELDTFAHYGFAPQLVAAGDAAAMQAALSAGALDVGFGSVVDVAAAHERGVPFLFLAAAAVYTPQTAEPGILVTARDAPIRTARELAGKTVAVNGAQSLAALAVRNFADRSGGNAQQIRFVERAPSEMAEAVRAGGVDAASIERIFAPSAGRGGDPLRVVATTYDLIGTRWVPSAWIASPTWIVRRQDDAKRLIAALREAGRWANGHPHESAAILAKVLNLPAEGIEGMSRAEFADRLAPAQLQPGLDLALRYHAIKAPLAAGLLVDQFAR